MADDKKVNDEIALNANGGSPYIKGARLVTAASIFAPIPTESTMQVKRPGSEPQGSAGSDGESKGK